MKRVSINEILEDNSKANEFFQFYDWFCKDESLERHFKSFLPKLKFLVNEGLLDGDNLYFWLKNNCPVNGSLYNDIRFSRISDEEFLGGITPKTGHIKELKCEMWFLKDGYKTMEFESWSDLKKELKTNKDLREEFKNNFK